MSDKRRHFITDVIDGDLESGKHTSVATRFPPEPNGYLHIGHAKAICLNFGLARDYGGRCHLRFDDTNPATEEVEYVESIQHDIKWLGFDWGEHLYFASDFFEQMYEHAVRLIQRGLAYVDSADLETIRKHRGTISEPGTPTPDRERSTEENLDLFKRMRAGEFKDGEMVLRAKIDLANTNMLMRDPILYRVRHAHHYRQGDDWCIYPLYDFAHCLEDSFEGITHSICTLEFTDNRELYDWVLQETEAKNQPRQYEMARLALTYTVMSKRKLLELVKDGHVNGWDDPRMPTIAGFRRRGYTAEAIRRFCDLIGVAKSNSLVDMAQLEFAIRDDLNQKAKRVLAVLDPLKVTIENYPEGEVEQLDAPYYPHDVPLEGSRKLPFGRTIYIERDDFREKPPKGYHRLSPGTEVRLRYAYFIRCTEVVKNDAGEVTELICTYDPETQGGKSPDGRKVKGTIHWVSAGDAVNIEVRVYDRLFTKEIPGVGDRDELDNPDPELLEVEDARDGNGATWLDHLNPDSLQIFADAQVEPSVKSSPVGSRFQFERQGYFVVDPDGTAERLVFNRVVPLRDSWAKKQKSIEQPKSQPKPKQDGGGPKEIPERTPELEARWKRYQDELGLDGETAEVLSRTIESAEFFEATLALHADATEVGKWIVNESKAREVSPEHLAELLTLLAEGTISGRIAKDVLEEMVAGGKTAKAIVAEQGLEQIADPAALEPIVEEILAANPDKVEAYKQGRTKLLGFFVGQVMKKTGGKANPQLVDQLVRARLA